MNSQISFMLFIILFIICVYYLIRINQCSKKFRELKGQFSDNIQNNINLSQQIDNLGKNNIENFYNYHQTRAPQSNNQICAPPRQSYPTQNYQQHQSQGSCSSNQQPMYTKNPNLDVNPDCAANQSHNPQRNPNTIGYSEVVPDSCSQNSSCNTGPYPPNGPYHPSGQQVNCHGSSTTYEETCEIDEQKKALDKDIKKAVKLLKKGMKTAKNIKKTCYTKETKSSRPSRPSHQYINAHNFPLVSPCYQQYQACVNLHAYPPMDSNEGHCRKGEDSHGRSKGKGKSNGGGSGSGGGGGGSHKTIRVLHECPMSDCNSKVILSDKEIKHSGLVCDCDEDDNDDNNRGGSSCSITKHKSSSSMGGGCSY